jgi:hypothetical protein
MPFRNVINDGSANPPRFRLQINLNSLSRSQQVDQIVSAGFGGVEAQFETPLEANEIAALLQERNLAIGVCAVAAEADELLPTIELAHRVRAEYLSVRVPGSLRSSPEIAEVLKDMYDLVNDAGLPLLVQTSRGSVMQDLRRTIKVLDRYKKLRLNADISGYVLAGELTSAWPDEICQHFEQIARRASGFGGRISFGNQSQDDIGAGEGELAQQFKKLWTLGFGAWLEKAAPGDVLPFTVNLASPTDAESLTIKRMAEEAWVAAQPVAAVESGVAEDAA